VTRATRSVLYSQPNNATRGALYLGTVDEAGALASSGQPPKIERDLWLSAPITHATKETETTYYCRPPGRTRLFDLNYITAYRLTEAQTH
jgi:hypothetical protein